MTTTLDRNEIRLLLAVLALLALALLAPAMAQPGQYHAFADNAGDVWSNLAFALAGAVGLVLMRNTVGGAQRSMAFLFFGGLIVVAAGSAWYHLAPNDAGLAVDRYCMVIAMASLLGLSVATHVSERAGAATIVSSLALGAIAVKAWMLTGNVLPWGVFQFGGMLLLVTLALLPTRAGALKIQWPLVIAAYAAAKLFEMNDHLIHEATHHLVSGHTLKHIAAALAAAPVAAAVAASRSARQNPVQLAA